MRALLDENIPRALIRLFAPEVDAWTVPQCGWSGLTNGRLLTTASAEFDVFITTDQGIPHQQNLSRYEIGIVLMEARSNRFEDLAPLVPEVKARVGSVAPGTVLRVAV
ncbi:DUF5615 family PIN-like protein [Rubrivirga marina]|uniref:Uncharacterized protein n=1 Tax=Rubrivirga marina TaxID=1196024 RepID=A0A271J264_9BACT|nr:DUF5615 family PIN-like protein [Rubrivirga marina]PAP76799.1 hypothetical protein BSZ37_10315 [Rubrivirga marina]